MAKNLKRTILSEKMPNNKHIIWALPQGEKINLKIFNNGLWRLASSGSNDSSLYEVDPTAFLITELMGLNVFFNTLINNLNLDTSNLTNEEIQLAVSNSINSISYRTENHGMATLASPFNFNTLIELDQQEPTLVFNCADGAIATMYENGVEFVGGQNSNIYTLTSSSTLNEIAQARNSGKTLITSNHGKVTLYNTNYNFICLCEDGWIYLYSDGLEGFTDFHLFPPSARYYIVPDSTSGEIFYKVYDRVAGNEVDKKEVLNLTEYLYLDGQFVLLIFSNEEAEKADSVIFKLDAFDLSIDSSFEYSIWHALGRYAYYQGSYRYVDVILRLIIPTSDNSYIDIFPLSNFSTLIDYTLPS